MTKRASRASRALFWTGLILLLIGIAPMVSAVLASAIAQSQGCTLNEGMANACMIFGRDWGAVLYAMFVAGWLFFVTMLLIPVGLIVLIIGSVMRWRRARPVVDSDA